jgi:hypothetical protein
VANLSRPDRDATTTPSGSHDRVRWRCSRGHGWETEVRQRVSRATQCPTCLAGLWTSRLEFQVAALVSAVTDLLVTVGARLPRSDRAADERVDLLIDDLGLFIDLDPSRWHSSAESISRDARKLERLSKQPYLRVRPARIGPLPVELADPDQQMVLPGDDERDPMLWAEAVLARVRTIRPATPMRPLTVTTRDLALAGAHRRWRDLRSEPRRTSLASEFPEISEQLLEVVGRPALTAADLSPRGDDRAVWACPSCGHRWQARVANRTVQGTGCPPCANRRGATRAAAPRPGQSFADVHPHLVPHFIADETNPGKTLFQLRPNSIDRCRWTCPHCARPWTTTPHHLNRNPGGGCRRCGHQRGGRTRRRPTAD